MNGQARHPTDQRAADANELQVLAHAQFKLLNQLFVVPCLEGA